MFPIPNRKLCLTIRTLFGRLIRHPQLLTQYRPMHLPHLLHGRRGPSSPSCSSRCCARSFPPRTDTHHASSVSPILRRLERRRPTQRQATDTHSHPLETVPPLPPPSLLLRSLESLPHRQRWALLARPRSSPCSSSTTRTARDPRRRPSRRPRRLLFLGSLQTDPRQRGGRAGDAGGTDEALPVGEEDGGW